MVFRFFRGEIEKKAFEVARTATLRGRPLSDVSLFFFSWVSSWIAPAGVGAIACRRRRRRSRATAVFFSCLCFFFRGRFSKRKFGHPFNVLWFPPCAAALLPLSGWPDPL